MRWRCRYLNNRRKKSKAVEPPERRYLTIATLFGASDRGETCRIEFVVDADEAFDDPSRRRLEA